MANRYSPYSTPSATRDVLERHGLFTKYALGQNFLVNDDIIRKIIELADVSADDCILEVGPGIGTLTYALASCAQHVVAIEKDADLPAVLADTLGDLTDRLTLLEMDALDVTNSILGNLGMIPNKLVSNLPYAVAATIVLDYFQNLNSLESAVVMVQKEVAERMAAKPSTKAYGAYTVKLSLYAQPIERFLVSPGNFFPPPHVDSAVLRLERTAALKPDGTPLSKTELAATCRMADAAFTNRRKTLMNSCKAYFASDPSILEHLADIFEEAGIDPKRRGETLTRGEFITLGLALSHL